MAVLVPLRFSIFQYQELQDVAAQVLVLDDVRELLGDVSGIYLHILLFEVGRFKRDFVENFFKNGVQTAGADVFGLLVHAGGEARNGGDGVLGDVELDSFGFQQRDVLLDQRVLRLRQNADEIFFLQRLQLYANGQPPLKLGNQVGRLGHVKRARRDEENVISANHPVARVDGRSLNDWKNVALHAFA